MATKPKKATAEVVDPIDVVIETEEKAVIKEPVQAPVPKKRDYKFPDHVMVAVQSNTYGELIYVNQRTGARVSWKEIGDVQPVPMGELRDMRNTQRGFFSNNRIFIVGVEDEEYSEAAPEDVYKALMVSQYYKDVIDPNNFNSIFGLEPHELRIRLNRMSDGAKTNLVVAANEAIRRGRLDSLKKIRVIEECLGCELIEIQ